jgi:catechol 2,3-dioxygenase-like lactoylglutathione lyase family enzyme
MAVTGLDHYTINVSDLDATVAFYTDVLGLKNGERPAFQFPGAWLYCGDTPIVHLIAGHESLDTGTGTIDHVAFRGEGLSAYTAKLTEKGIAFEERDVPGKPLHQVFLHDPNGVKVEINFWDDG